MGHEGEGQVRRRCVAVLGTGIMGSAMARNLCRSQYEVRVWNRTRAKAENLAEEGAFVADTPSEAVRGATVILTVLNDGASVSEVMASAGSALTAGTVWAQLSTVGVDATVELSEFAQRQGLVFVNAPVQGTKAPAEEGQLIVLASGPEAARAVVQPVFDVIGKRTLWVAGADDITASSRLKLVLNSWAFALTHGAAEALALAKGLGVDPKHFLDVVSGGPMDNAYLQLKGAAILADDYTTSFSVANAEKDSRLVVEAAEKAGVRTDVAAAGWQRFQRAVENGHSEKDMAATYLAD